MAATATESFKRSLIHSLQEWFEPTPLSQLEDRLHRETFICSAPLHELADLKIPKVVDLLVDLPVRSAMGKSVYDRWELVPFRLFFVERRRMDGELRAVYEAHA